MSISSKQDRQGARTPADLEYKYQFGKTFAEIMGIATDARNTAEHAAELDEQLTQEEIFNRLTNNGEVQAVFRGEDGQLYINAAYVVALAEMFAKNITMTGTLSNTVEAFLEPGDEEMQTLYRHLIGEEYIIPSRQPLYDFNGDGELDDMDLIAAEYAIKGTASLAEWEGAVKTPVTMTIDLNDPEAAIRFTGTNMWGREIDEHIGVAGATMRHTGSANFVIKEGAAMAGNNMNAVWYYRKWYDGRVECWLDWSVACDFSTRWGEWYTASAYTGQIPYPFEFNTVPTEIVTARCPSAAVFLYTEGDGIGMNTTTKTASYRVARPTAANVGETRVKYSFYVYGYLK